MKTTLQLFTLFILLSANMIAQTPHIVCGYDHFIKMKNITIRTGLV
ncbi:MAG: hypothetical protein IPP69_16045 [Flavobacteriales bacterium]|nr:hypothetical protein [Flavobacteriales bacterium]